MLEVLESLRVHETVPGVYIRSVLTPANSDEGVACMQYSSAKVGPNSMLMRPATSSGRSVALDAAMRHPGMILIHTDRSGAGEYEAVDRMIRYQL